MVSHFAFNHMKPAPDLSMAALLESLSGSKEIRRDEATYRIRGLSVNHLALHHSNKSHERWPASDDVLPGSSIQAPSKTSVRFATGAGRAIHAGSRMRNRSAASGDSEGLRLFESGR